jgi:hypothetical protein
MDGLLASKISILSCKDRIIGSDYVEITDKKKRLCILGYFSRICWNNLGNPIKIQDSDPEPTAHAAGMLMVRCDIGSLEVKRVLASHTKRQKEYARLCVCVCVSE